MSLTSILQDPQRSHAYLLVASQNDTLHLELTHFLQNGAAEMRAFAQSLVPEEGKIDVEAARRFRQSFSLQSVTTISLGIIEQVDKMTIPAQQMLLKLLEEAPKQVLFLLTTTKPRTLSRPILSRLRLLRIPDKETLIDQDFIAKADVLFDPQKLLFEKQQMLEKLLKSYDSDTLLYNLSHYLWRKGADSSTLQKWFSTLSYTRHTTTLRNALEYFFLT
ncbi:MAG: hypothetical protein HY817_04365 [Candidatus Abawacabacteria bacterium]|nr:hypothetical protein [Candidatus Abawacabacteria bacterium]